MVRWKWHKVLEFARYNKLKLRASPALSRLWVQVSQLTRHHCTSVREFSAHLYGAMLQECIRRNDHIGGRALHCEIMKKGNCLDLFANNILLNMYCKIVSLDDAGKMFDHLSEKNTITYITLIHGHIQSSQFVEAVKLFIKMHRGGHDLNPFVFTTVLKLIVSMEQEELGYDIHACVYKLGHDSNAFVATALIDTYSLCGDVDSARQVFDAISNRDIVSWAGIITCYADNDYSEKSLQLFSQMRIDGFEPNSYTYVRVLKTSIELGAFYTGQTVHGCTLKAHYELHHYVSLALLDLYVSFGHPNDALKVFDPIPKSDVIPWSFMISKHAQNSQIEDALELFCKMRQTLVASSQFALASALQACASFKSLDLGEQIHCLVIQVGLDTNPFVYNAVMDMYAKCGRMANSVKLFLESKNRNNVMWNTIIVCYVQLGIPETALDLFKTMIRSQVEATEVTYSSILRACSSLSTIEFGAQIHCVSLKNLYGDNVVVANALLDMYAKCGNIDAARLVFDTLRKRDEVSYNALITGYSINGSSGEALNTFEMMLESNYEPCKLTFVGVLSACCNGGLVDKGRAYFKLMIECYGIEPCMEHYTCMVGLLGRSGHFEDAIRLIDEIPLDPCITVWHALLGACIIHCNVELGRISASCALKIDPQDEATYVLLANLYTCTKRWENAALIRRSMKIKGVKKEPGLSWIEK